MDEDTLEPLATVPQLKGSAAKAARAERARQHQRVFASNLIPATSQAARQAGADAANFEQTIKAEAKPTGLEMFGAAMAGNTSATIYDALFRDRHEKVAGYKPMMSEVPKDADSALMARIASSGSPAETAEYVQEFQDEQMRVNAVMSRGMGTGIALQFGAEFADPTNILMPFAVAKGLARVGKGSDTLFAAGKTSQGYQAAITENVLSGSAVEAFKQSVEGEFRPVDLAISLTADALIGAGTGWLSARNAANRVLDSAAMSAADRELGLVARAERELGEGAEPAAIREVMERMRKDDANAMIKDSVAVSDDLTGGLNMRTLTRGEADTPESRVLGDIEGAGQYPTVNIAEPVGRLQREAPNTPEFKEFFGGSKAVDQEGKPVVVYHMTKAENLEAFDKDKLGTNTGVASAKEGFFFAGDPNTVNVYANTAAATGESPNVIPVYLSLQNPMEFDMGGSLYRKRSYASLLREAKNKGYDGAIIRNTFDGGSKDDIYVAFEPTQIKSAISNTGMYSKDDPRIQYSRPSGLSKVDQAVYDAYPPRARFESGGSLTRWEANFNKGGDFADEIAGYTGGKYNTLEDLKALPAGVHASGSLSANTKQTVAAIQSLAKRFMPDMALTVHFDLIPHNGSFAHAKVGQVNSKIAMVVIDPTLAPSQMVRAAIHELGHVVFNRGVEAATKEELAGIKKAFNLFRAEASNKAPDGNVARAMRFSITNVDQQATKEASDKLVSNYQVNFDEYAAEQFVKYTEKNMEKLGLAAKTVAMLKEAIDRVLRLFKAAKREAIDVDQEFEAFFESLLDGQAKTTDGGYMLSNGPLAQMATPSDVVNEIQADSDAVRFGLNLAPVNTPAERANVQAMIALHKKAEQWEQANPMDAAWMERAKNLANNDVFNVASIGLTMLNSPSPLVRMLASELLEDASGVAGKRRNTAAISKYLIERQMMANAVNDVQDAYHVWKVGKPGASLKDELFSGVLWDNWNKELATEIEARRAAGGPVNPDGNVKAAVDSIEAAYQRIADAQRKFDTIGAAGLPTTSVGYMPHKMNPQAVMNLTNGQRQVMHEVLVDQFVTIEGWDITFSDKLASQYMARVRARAAGDYGSVVSGAGMADIVREALVGMKLPEDVIEDHMDKFMKGAMGQTKKRIELDLNKVYSTPDGDFRLMDVFETDQIELLRKQAGGASGEVALTKHGIRGRPAVQMIRNALQYGADGKRVAVNGPEWAAFDQMIAEFRNEPFGTHTGKWLDRAMMANSLVRLGGIFFNQLAESINGVVHLGAIRAFESVASIPRLRQEIIALSKGKQVDNPIIGSIEIAGGAEFGTDAYKFVMPFDSPNHAYPTYGQDTLTATDRLLRGGGYLQGKLSGWRALHSAQQRGMAEQIVHKMMRYIREGKDDVALEQFGVTPAMRTYLQANLNTFAKFDASGRLVEFDATKIADPDMLESVVQTVHRGTQQIIQGTFIGERGKWAHDGMLKLMTQFRTFSITSMEKQWGRQRNSHGAMGAFGLLIGTMTLAAPIYMARTYLNSVGRPDQEAYLEERLSPEMVARATLNYAASSGVVGDVADLLTAPMPESWGVKSTGGRSGQESDFVGNYIAPASSLVNDIWSYAQSPLELDDAAKIMPFRNIPYLVPLMNQTRDAE